MARGGRFLFFLLVVGAGPACLPEELEMPSPGGGGGSADTSEDGGIGGSPRTSTDGAQGGGGIEASSTIVGDADAASDRTATGMDAMSDVRPRDAADAATVRDVAADRPAPVRDAPGVRTDSRADVIGERPTVEPIRDASDACVRTCPSTPLVLNARCADGCGGTCPCAVNLSCTTMGGSELLCLTL